MQGKPLLAVDLLRFRILQAQVPVWSLEYTLFQENRKYSVAKGISGINML